MKVTRHILILAIGGVLFWVALGQYATSQSHLDWIDVIPYMHGQTSKNLTTSAFNVTGEKWGISWWPGGSGNKCTIEIYDASTDMKLQEFTLSVNWPEVSAGTGDIETTGSFYLEIQVYTRIEHVESWIIRVREYKPQPPFLLWISWIIVVSATLAIGWVGYEVYKVMRE